MKQVKAVKIIVTRCCGDSNTNRFLDFGFDPRSIKNCSNLPDHGHARTMFVCLCKYPAVLPCSLLSSVCVNMLFSCLCVCCIKKSVILSRKIRAHFHLNADTVLQNNNLPNISNRDSELPGPDRVVSTIPAGSCCIVWLLLSHNHRFVHAIWWSRSHHDRHILIRNLRIQCFPFGMVTYLHDRTVPIGHLLLLYLCLCIR